MTETVRKKALSGISWLILFKLRADEAAEERPANGFKSDALPHRSLRQAEASAGDKRPAPDTVPEVG